MKYLTLETFTDFVCIGSDCPFTCCQDWRIVVDEETDRYYQSVEGEMGERLRTCIHHEDGNAWFILREEDKHCPFLNEKGLCNIVLSLGEEHLSNTCAFYPRYMFYEGDICFAGISISCPEAARFFLTHEEPLLIDFGENNDNTGVKPDTDWKLFNWAIRVFTTAVSIAQNRDFSVKERIALVVLLVNGFQACVDEGNDPSDLIGLYSKSEYYGAILDQTGIYNRDLTSKVSFSTGIMYFFRSVQDLEAKLPELSEIISYFDNPENSSVDVEVWENAFKRSVSTDNEIWRENVLVYTLFKYFMTGLSEKNFYEKLMTGIGAVLNMSMCITALYNVIHGEAPATDYIIMLVSRLSRMIEHNAPVTGEFTEYTRKAGFTDPGFVLKLIS